MSAETTLDVLERWGDTLERAICEARHYGSEQSSDLSQILYPYSEIWCEHILPRRDKYDLTRLDGEHARWVTFSANHYTALVKIYQTFRKYGELLSCCEQASHGDLSAELLLQAQDATAGFWEHAGSAIDNLGRCFDEAPGLNYHRGDGLRLLQGDFPSLAFTFNRRTQMIHYALVPLGFDHGAIVFNERDFDNLETTWDPKRYTADFVETYYGEQWKSTMNQLAAAWWRLRAEVKRVDPKPPPIPEALLDPAVEMRDGHNMMSGSGISDVIQSNSTRGKPKSAEPYWIRGQGPASSATANW